LCNMGDEDRPLLSEPAPSAPLMPPYYYNSLGARGGYEETGIVDVTVICF